MASGSRGAPVLARRARGASRVLGLLPARSASGDADGGERPQGAPDQTTRQSARGASPLSGTSGLTCGTAGVTLADPARGLLDPPALPASTSRPLVPPPRSAAGQIRAPAPTPVHLAPGRGAHRPPGSGGALGPQSVHQPRSGVGAVRGRHSSVT